MNMHSESIAKISSALSKAQHAFSPVIKSSQAHRHKYADLGECYNATRDALFANELSVCQFMSHSPEGKQVMVTTLSHSSGEFISGHTNFDINPYGPASNGSTALHAWGAAITYVRRYAYCTMLGIIGEDEDQDGHDVHSKPKETKENASIGLIDLQKNLAALIKKEGFDGKGFVNYHKISVDNPTQVLESIVNFNDLLQKFRMYKLAENGTVSSVGVINDED